MYATRAMRQAAHAAERAPLIKFIGRRTIPCLLPGKGNSHPTFSSYRDHAQQHGPLRKTIGAQTGAHLGPVEPPRGVAFDRNDLPERFRRVPLTLAEIEAVETGGAALFS